MTRRWVTALAVAAALVGADPAAAQLAPPPSPTIDAPAPRDWPTPPDLDAPVVLLVEASTGQVLTARAADERRAVASTVKILTALAVHDAVDLDDEVTVGDEVVDVPGASVSLAPGDTWTVRQLLEAVLLRSGNDAATALAVHVDGELDAFAPRLTDTAAAVGIDVGAGGARVVDPTGLGDADNLLSAQDLATAARVLLADDDLRGIVGLDEVDLPGLGPQDNRNLLVGSYPGASGVKTGFTEQAGNGVVASAVRDGRELVAVVLGAGADPERFVDATTLLDFGFTAFDTRTLERTATVLVAGGRRQLQVPTTTITVPDGAEADLAFVVPPRLDGTLGVPVVVDGATVTTIDTTTSGTVEDTTSDAATVGRGLADAVHVALRAVTAGPADATGSTGEASR